MNDPDDARVRLAVYGTLAPGQPNHHEVADLGGRWFAGRVRGRLVDDGWGATMGYPGVVLDRALDDTVPVQVLESNDLPVHWARLDDFEGPGYRRVAVEVETDHGVVAAFIYELSGR